MKVLTFKFDFFWQETEESSEFQLNYSPVSIEYK